MDSSGNYVPYNIKIHTSPYKLYVSSQNDIIQIINPQKYAASNVSLDVRTKYQVTQYSFTAFPDVKVSTTFLTEDELDAFMDKNSVVTLDNVVVQAVLMRDFLRDASAKWRGVSNQPNDQYFTRNGCIHFKNDLTRSDYGATFSQQDALNLINRVLTTSR